MSVEIDFEKFELGRENDIMIEFPTQTDSGILLSHDLTTKVTQSNWFKVLKVGRSVTSIKVGEEAFIYFYNPPVVFEEFDIYPRRKQQEKIDKEILDLQKEKTKIIKTIKPTWEGAPKEVEPEGRKFAVLNAHDVILREVNV